MPLIYYHLADNLTYRQYSLHIKNIEKRNIKVSPLQSCSKVLLSSEKDKRDATSKSVGQRKNTDDFHEGRGVIINLSI